MIKKYIMTGVPPAVENVCKPKVNRKTITIRHICRLSRARLQNLGIAK